MVVVKYPKAVGLDSKRGFLAKRCEKSGKSGKKMGKEVIRYGISAYDIIEINYFIGLRIWPWFISLRCIMLS